MRGAHGEIINALAKRRPALVLLWRAPACCQRLRAEDAVLPYEQYPLQELDGSLGPLFTAKSNTV